MWNAQVVATKVVLTPLFGMEMPISAKNVGGSSRSWEHRWFKMNGEEKEKLRELPMSWKEIWKRVIGETLQGVYPTEGKEKKFMLVFSNNMAITVEVEELSA